MTEIFINQIINNKIKVIVTENNMKVTPDF